jgi:hypothetical protein
MNPQFSDLANELEDTKTDNQELQIDEGQTTQCPKEKKDIRKRAATPIKCCGVNICKNDVLSLCNVYKYIITMFFRFSRTVR